ncbi:MAG: ATP-binding protein [Candidatus Aenigmatarchaeota archaeon]|nr:MAG: ATP-binding protein [Candidatus Aenigmarchaeota archaeon]
MAVEKIVVGRNREDLKKFGSTGTVYIGKHIVGTGEEAHLTNPICMDVVRPHVILICGKRGSGKSYSAGVMAEEMVALPKDIKQNLSILMIDTMGIYWSMKKPNEKERGLLERWNLKPNAMKEMRFFIPKGWVKEYEKAGIGFDFPFTLPTGELSAQDWVITFGFNILDEHGILTERVIKKLKKTFGDVYSIDQIIKEIENDKKAEQKVKNALISRFMAAQGWGVFERKGTPIERFLQPGKISVIDISHYLRSSTGWSVRTLVIGLFARRIFQTRLMARKKEEVEVITGEKRKSMPMVWMIMDEAHQFIPNKGVTAASEPVLTLIKEGREPGISQVLITQIPNKLHSDALAQSDLVISHRLTSEADIKALRGIMQSYMLEDIQELINTLPRQKGSAIILDDNSERIYSLQVRPRISWHAGGSPKAIKEKGLFD